MHSSCCLPAFLLPLPQIGYLGKVTTRHLHQATGFFLEGNMLHREDLGEHPSPWEPGCFSQLSYQL